MDGPAADSLQVPGRGTIDHQAEDDSALVRAAQRDPAAFGLIYERYGDRVFSYMRARFSSADAADDLTQQAFTRALQALPKYRLGKAPFGAWLFRIARSTAVDAIRKRRFATVPLEFVPEAALRPDVDEAPGLDERLAALRGALRSIPSRDREVLALRFAGALTAREIGEVVGRSEAAVQKQLSRTIANLKEHYRELDIS